MKKRLLKDLPFGHLNKNSVLTKNGCGYFIDNGVVLYTQGGGADNGKTVFEKEEEDIIDMIWDNPDWFIDAEIKNIVIKAGTQSIEIIFDAVDLGQAQLFARGINHCLKSHYGQDGNYSWNIFKGFTATLK